MHRSICLKCNRGDTTYQNWMPDKFPHSSFNQSLISQSALSIWNNSSYPSRLLRNDNIERFSIRRQCHEEFLWRKPQYLRTISPFPPIFDAVSHCWSFQRTLWLLKLDTGKAVKMNVLFCRILLNTGNQKTFCASRLPAIQRHRNITLITSTIFLSPLHFYCDGFIVEKSMKLSTVEKLWYKYRRMHPLFSTLQTCKGCWNAITSSFAAGSGLKLVLLSQEEFSDMIEERKLCFPCITSLAFSFRTCLTYS